MGQEGYDVLQRIPRLAIAAPRRMIAIALLVMVGTAVFGIPVSKSLSAGGFQDPASESSQATQLLTGKFNQGDMQLIFTLTSQQGAKSQAARAVGSEIVEQLRRSPYVAAVISTWTVTPATSAALVSEDGNTRMIEDGIDG